MARDCNMPARSVETAVGVPPTVAAVSVVPQVSHPDEDTLVGFGCGSLLSSQTFLREQAALHTPAIGIFSDVHNADVLRELSHDLIHEAETSFVVHCLARPCSADDAEEGQADAAVSALIRRYSHDSLAGEGIPDRDLVSGQRQPIAAAGGNGGVDDELLFVPSPDSLNAATSVDCNGKHDLLAAEAALGCSSWCSLEPTANQTMPPRSNSSSGVSSPIPSQLQVAPTVEEAVSTPSGSLAQTHHSERTLPYWYQGGVAAHEWKSLLRSPHSMEDAALGKRKPYSPGMVTAAVHHPKRSDTTASPIFISNLQEYDAALAASRSPSHSDSPQTASRREARWSASPLNSASSSVRAPALTSASRLSDSRDRGTSPYVRTSSMREFVSTLPPSSTLRPPAHSPPSQAGAKMFSSTLHVPTAAYAAPRTAEAVGSIVTPSTHAQYALYQSDSTTMRERSARVVQARR
ncbi:MAG: hypothetical protein EOO65_03510 [Methanosarcinales archaeon]|nr:MAG: hypothetical protein EOO65_03510 [Methanosarcinales archaeon]